jgi:hypothetical protein
MKDRHATPRGTSIKKTKAAVVVNEALAAMAQGE